MTTAMRSAGAAVAVVALAGALVAGWRVLAVGIEAAADPSGAAARLRSPFAAEDPVSEQAWRAQVGRDPTDHVALVMLARAREQGGDAAGARAAMDAALRLAPVDRQTLLEAAAFRLRAGDAAQATPILRRVADLYPEARSKVWPVLSGVLASGALDAYFAELARADPKWWPSFFGHACAAVGDSGTLQRMLEVRALAGAAGAAERRCVIDRLQRDGLWPQAYQTWLNSLPPADRRRVGYVYNGDFERALSNVGFDWRVTPQQGVLAALAEAGASGGHALRVEFANARWSGPPVQQYLMLAPGRYAFAGQGRADRLQGWLGVQWWIRCVVDRSTPARALVRSGAARASAQWQAWREEFTVPPDCPVQVVRLELANPRDSTATPGDVAARLDGSVWFDNLTVRSLD